MANGPDPRPNELDPVILLWSMRRHVCHEHISQPRVVIQFDFGGPKRRYWLVVESRKTSRSVSAIRALKLMCS